MRIKQDMIMCYNGLVAADFSYDFFAFRHVRLS